MGESFDWFKVAQALFLIAMIAFIWPSAKRMFSESPKGTQKQWMNYAALMCGVVLFVLFLISSVRS